MGRELEMKSLIAFWEKMRLSRYTFFWAILLGSILLLSFYYNMKISPIMMTTDDVTEMEYARQAWLKKSIFPEGSCYSTEFPFNRSMFLAIPLYGLTENFLGAYWITMLLGALLMCVSFYSMMRAAKITRSNALFACCLLMTLFPFLLRFTVVQSFAYAWMLCVFFFTIRVYLKLKEISSWEYALSVFFSFWMGACSLRFLPMLYIPLLTISYIECLRNKQYLLSCWESKQMRYSVKVTIAFFLGWALLMRLMDVYDVSIVSASVGFPEGAFFLAHLLRAIDMTKQFLELDMQNVSGWIVGFHFLWLVLAVTSAAFLLKNREKVMHVQIILISIIASSQVMMYGAQIVSGFIEARYDVILGILTILIVTLSANMLYKILDKRKQVVMMYVCFAVAILSIGTSYIYGIHKYRHSGGDVRHLVQVLKDNGVQKTFSSYWETGHIVAMSNHLFFSSHIGYYDPANPKHTFDLRPMLWLTSKDAFLPSESRNQVIALILTNDEIRDLDQDGKKFLERCNKKEQVERFQVFYFIENPFVGVFFPAHVGEECVYPLTYASGFRTKGELTETGVFVGEQENGEILWGPDTKVEHGVFDIVLECESRGTGKFVLTGRQGIHNRHVLAEADIVPGQQTISIKSCRLSKNENIEFIVKKESGQMHLRRIHLVRKR